MTTQAIPRAPARTRRFVEHAGLILSAVVILWLLCCGLYLPLVLSAGLSSPSAFGLPAAILLGLFFALFWLYAAYHLVVFAASRLLRVARREAPPGLLIAHGAPPVAILYTTMNDFDPAAAQSCLDQDYSNFRLFLLDDSTDEQMRRQVDQFASGQPGRAVVVRRRDRAGFKAGNLNHALRGPAAAFPFFAVVDADCVLPKDFVRQLVARLLADPDAAFVQAACHSRSDEGRRLPAIMSPVVDIMWDTYIPYRERFGFTLLMGHGALVRRSAWDEVGGFPSIVAEDVGFAFECRERGFRGLYAPHPVCYEALPPTLGSYCGQQAKYSRGACQWFWLYGRRAAFSTQLAWFEKLDLALFIFSNLLSGVFFLFLLFIGLVVPLVFYDIRVVRVGLAQYGFPWVASIPHAELGRMLSWEFYGVSLLCIVAPLLSTLAMRGVRWKNRFLFLAWSTMVHLSVIPQSLFETIRFLCTGKADFFVTGERLSVSGGRRTGQGKVRAALDIASGVIFIALALLTGNPYLAAVGIAILIGMSMRALFETEQPPRFWNAIAGMPLVLLALAVSQLGLGLISAQGTVFTIVPFHF